MTFYAGGATPDAATGEFPDSAGLRVRGAAVTTTAAPPTTSVQGGVTSSGGSMPPGLAPGMAPSVARASMRLRRYQYTDDWNAGILTGATLDTVVYAGAYGHAAVVPQAVSTFATITGAQAVRTSQSPATGVPVMVAVNTLGLPVPAFQTEGGVAYSYQAGDGIQFTTTATGAVQIQLAGFLRAGVVAAGPPTVDAGAIRNGCIANLIVDGVVRQTLDTANGAPLAQVYLTGPSHSVQVVHSGSYGNAVRPIGPVTQTAGGSSGGGASVAAQALPTPLAHPTFVAALWRVAQVTDGAHYALYRTLPGGSESQIATGLQTGMHYVQYVPGVDLLVGNGTLLATGDGATFTTDVVTFAVESVAVGVSSGAATGGSTYTTPTMDNGDPRTQWFLAEWDQDPGMPPLSARILTGDTPTPDQSWSSAAIPLAGATVLPSGRGVGTAGLLASGVARGRYGVLVFSFPAVSTVPAWMRDLCVYAWIPERDPAIMRKVGWPDDVEEIGPTMAAYMGTLAVVGAELRQDVYDFVGSYGIQGAVDQYLAAHGADRDIARYAGEPPQSYRTRLLAASSARTTQASVPGLCSQIAQLVVGTTDGLSTSVVGGYTVSSCQGVVVAQAAGQQVRITIPAPPYAGLPGLSAAQAPQVITAHIQTIAPLATVVFPNRTGSNITFS